MVIIIASALLSYFFSGEQDLIKVSHFCSLAKMIFNITGQIIPRDEGKVLAFLKRSGVQRNGA